MNGNNVNNTSTTTTSNNSDGKSSPTTSPQSPPTSAASTDTPLAENNTAVTNPASQPPRQPAQRSTSTASSVTLPPPLRKQLSGNLSNSGSAGASPRTSRNGSPVRKDGPLRPQPLAQPLATQPSAAAIQRALSAASAPSLQPNADASTRTPRRGAPGSSGDSTPQWPVSPRLKSPPPSISAASSRRPSASTTVAMAVAPKKTDGPATPAISVQGATPVSAANPAPVNPSGEDTPKASQLQTLAKAAPSRGPSGKSTLETVQENSTDDLKEPSPASLKAAADLKPPTKLEVEDNKIAKRDSDAQHPESGNESTGKGERKAERPTTLTPQNSSLSQRPKSTAKLSSTKSRPEGKQGMTVETETVASIPQSAINPGDRSGGRSDNAGSVRLKPSNETIRPKKERKKALQKPRSVNQSSASSRADIFEARVASAVDEANSSDSDETFVYESNPPEQQRRGGRHHSRTPSVASQQSMADQVRSGVRAFADSVDDRRIAGKRSMKFSNNLYNDLDSPESKDGSVRSHQPRHFGRFGRGGSHASVFDPDSPYTQASKLRPPHLNSQRRSRPESPRSPQNGSRQQSQGPNSSPPLGKKQESQYDIDIEAADDERTPLMSTVRTARGGRPMRRVNINSLPDVDEYYGVRRQSRCGRFGGFLLGFCVLALVILSAVGFLVMSNRPLRDIEVEQIQNVLASEQELILDLYVGAVNPNYLGITISDVDLSVFAKSRYVRTDKFWRDHGFTTAINDDSLPIHAQEEVRVEQDADGDEFITVDLSQHWGSPVTTLDGVDKGTDPPDDGAGHDSQTMLLGRIFHLDQSLSFDGSPLKLHRHFSVGSLRVERPGNKTETGGSERWERVLLHPFDLIVRGTLWYSLPISQRPLSAIISAVARVSPDDDDDGPVDGDVPGWSKVEAVQAVSDDQWIQQLDQTMSQATMESNGDDVETASES